MSSLSFDVPQIQKIMRGDFIALIQKTLAVLARPGQTIELRIPNAQGKRTDSGYFTDSEKLANAALSYDGRAEGIYITLNPLNPALLARSVNRVKEYAKQTSSDKDVLRRLWLFIDFDPVRPAGISSSEEEHQAAIECAKACRERLAQRSIPSILADSGNGAHLLIPIDWPNDEASTALVKDFLSFLDKKFSDTRVKVDTGMVGASHLIKLYGTIARKGDNTAERPYRRSTLLELPESLDPVPADVIQNLLAPPAPPAESEKTNPAVVERDEQPTPTQDRTFIDEVKARLDMVAYAEQQLGVQATGNGAEVRLPGNAGFLINIEKGVWYHHGGQEGGDALDLVGYFLYNASWNKRDADQFKQALHTAANFAGVPIPKWKKPTQAGLQKQGADTTSSTTEGSAIKPDPAQKLDLLDVAVAWKAKYGNDLAWDADRARWRRWTGTHWQVERTSEMLDLQAAQMMREVGVNVYSGSRSDGVLKFARGLCKGKFPLGQPFVNFKNGTLDLSSLQLREHAREDHLTRCLPYESVEDSDFTRIQQLLTHTIPDPTAQQAYMTHIGAALIGDTTLHKTIILFGPTRSGKTTLLKLAQVTLGYKSGQFPTSTLFSS